MLGHVTSMLRLVVAVLHRLGGWVDRPWVAYPALLLLQLKVIWGDWRYRDLTSGDTSSYFVAAYRWYRDFGVDLVWSPLYTAFYGSLLHLSPDAYIVTELHRLIPVLVVAALVLAVMRRLLPHGIAWFIGAWWTLLHINFDHMYEVHLFSLIPVLVAVLVVSGSTRPWARGVALALLLASTFLLRHELILATGIFAGLCLAWEARTLAMARGARAAQARTLLVSYSVPLLVAAPIVGFFAWQSLRHNQNLAGTWKSKADLTFCQHHALAYVQFRKDWTLSPWTECQQLLQQNFGKPSVTVFEALRLNPATTVVDHFGTNLNLLPRGMQVALFNATHGYVSPDVIPVPLRSRRALASSVALMALIVAGAVLLVRDRRHWWPRWLRRRVWGWIALASLAAAVLLSMLIIRPRPEYLYGPALLLMAGAGLSVAVIGRHWPPLKQFRVLLPLAVAGVLLLAPMHYAEYLDGGRVAKRPLLREYRRINPFGEILARPGTVFMKGHHSTAIWNYVFKRGPVTVLEYHGLGEALANNRALEAFLDEKGVTAFYLDDDLLAGLERNSLAAGFLAAPEAAGWEVVHSEDAPDSRWLLLRRSGQF